MPGEGKAGKILLEPLGRMQDCHRTDWTDFHDGSYNAAKFAQTIPLIFLWLWAYWNRTEHVHVGTCWHFHCGRIMIVRIGSFPLWESPHSSVAGWGQTGLLGSHLIHQECPPPSRKPPKFAIKDIHWRVEGVKYSFDGDSGNNNNNEECCSCVTALLGGAGGKYWQAPSLTSLNITTQPSPVTNIVLLYMYSYLYSETVLIGYYPMDSICLRS